MEGAQGDAEELGDRGDGAAGVGQQVAGGLDDFLGGDGGAPADSAAGTGGGKALVGAEDDEFADELREGGEGGEDVEDEPAAGVVVSRFSWSEVRPISRSRACLQLGAERVLASRAGRIRS
ncbi:hypothetical protein ABZY45_13540 [Streptomyces sp. NPDC006516]|uniref:hypothetical protein n=1 Tax=Streptomyces sp. NPDC006516 TaxID=3154309 RepID=UPI0033BD5AE7